MTSAIVCEEKFGKGHDKDSVLRFQFLFFAITTVGSTLSAIVSFIRIEETFGNLLFLGVALSTKTLLLAFAAPMISNFISRYGLWSAMFWSQIFGVLALFPLFYGFQIQSFPLALLGMLALGIPSMTLGISTTVSLRVLIPTADGYQRGQGSIAMISGFAMLFATLLGAELSRRISFSGVLILDAMTYFVGVSILFLKRKDFKTFYQNEKPSIQSQVSPLKVLSQKTIIKSSIFLTAAISMAAVFLLKGLPPILAGSSKVELAQGIPIFFRESLWSFEAFAILCSGWIYRHLSGFRARPGVSIFLWCNSVLLLVFLLPSFFAIKALALFTLSLLMILGQMKVRDDFILKFQTLEETQKATTSFTLLSNILLTLSPILITTLLGILPSVTFIFGCFLIQFVLWSSFIIWNRLGVGAGQNSNDI